MSQWTHVAATIRFDALRLPGFPDQRPALHRDIPEGSEGPLIATLWENPQRNHLASYTATIFGDLRDFGEEDVKSIRDYFHRLTSGETTMVRQGVAVVRVEYGPTIVMWHDRDKGWQEHSIAYVEQEDL